MRLLGIDSSSYAISLAGMEEDKTIFKFHKRIKKGASRIVVYIEKLLRGSSVGLEEFDGFVVGAGPGSFTGLRISFSIIKGLSMGLSKPVIALGSFLSMAEQVKNLSSKIAVITDARRNLVYATSFVLKNNKLIKEKKENLYTLEEFFSSHQDYLFVSYDAHIRDKAKKSFRNINFYSRDVWPDAIVLLKLAKDFYIQERFTPITKLEPLYIYPKECQVRNV